MSAHAHVPCAVQQQQRVCGVIHADACIGQRVHSARYSTSPLDEFESDRDEDGGGVQSSRQGAAGVARATRLQRDIAVGEREARDAQRGGGAAHAAAAICPPRDFAVEREQQRR